MVYKNRCCKSCAKLFKCWNATYESKPCEFWKSPTYREKINRCGKKLYFVRNREIPSFKGYWCIKTNRQDEL